MADFSLWNRDNLNAVAGDMLRKITGDESAMTIPPDRSYELNKAIAKARENYREFVRTIAGWPPFDSLPYQQYIRVITEAVVTGWDARDDEVAELRKAVALLEAES